MSIDHTAATRLALGLAVVILSGCVSYEPAVLVPEITLSPENISLTENTGSDAALNFGIEAGVNESDSLFNIEVLPGIVVRQLDPGGAAEAASIQAGDIILTINDITINHPDALQTVEREGLPGTYTFTVQRGTTVFATEVIPRAIAEANSVRELFRIDPLATRTAYQSTVVTIRDREDLVGARVIRFYPGSPLPGAGFSEGDIILALNNTYLSSAQDLVTRLNRDHKLGDRVSFMVFHDDAISERSLRLWDPGRRISRIALGPLLQYESSLNPDRRQLSILDLWLFSLYDFRQQDNERSHSLLGIFNFSSDMGELTEE